MQLYHHLPYLLTSCITEHMKVILYMAISANGLIAREDHRTDWSDEELKSYISKVKETGNLIIGRRTYEIMQQDTSPDANMSNLGNPQIVVISNKKSKDTSSAKFVSSPKAAIEFLKSKNFTCAMVAGGSKLIASFLKERLVDEIFLDIEPILFGKGIPLLFPVELEENLQLIGTKMLGKNTIQLHYKIRK